MNSTIKYNLFGLTLLLGLSFIIISVTNDHILTINVYDDAGQYLSGNPDQELAVFKGLQQWIWISSALYSVFKIAIIALIIYTALYLSDQQITFGRVFGIVVYAEFIFVLSAIIKILWFRFEFPGGSLENWLHLSPLSFFSLFPNAPPDWTYPLQTLSLYEVAYWFLLAWGIKRSTALDFDGSLKIVLVSYVPALLIWMCAVAFFTLMMLPSGG